MSSAVDPVAEVIMAVRPPTKAIVIERQNAPKRPTWGSTPAIPEKAIASGIIAKATTSPERTSRTGLLNHFRMAPLVVMGRPYLSASFGEVGFKSQLTESW